MRLDKRIDGLIMLLEAFRHSGSFYIIGAGVSKGIVPLNKELSVEILKSVFSRGGAFPVDLPHYDEYSHKLYRRVIGDDVKLYDLMLNNKDLAEAVRGSFPYSYSELMNNPDQAEDTIFRPILNRIHSHSLFGLTAQALTPKNNRVIQQRYYQYVVFSLIAKPSTILCLNTDGILARYSLGHYFCEWHGRVKNARSPWWDDLIDASFLYEFEFPRIRDWTPPGPEPKEVISRSKRSWVEPLFREANSIIIVGYSFGIFNESLDDSVTFEYLCRLLKHYPKNVLIVDPDPWNSEFISNLVKQITGRKNVYALPVRWDCLCQALMTINERCSINKLLYEHDKLAT